MRSGPLRNEPLKLSPYAISGPIRSWAIPSIQTRQYANRPDLVVLALPRGGVPVGFEVAKMLNLPLDVFIVRKLGVPGHDELAMGAIASGGRPFWCVLPLAQASEAHRLLENRQTIGKVLLSTGAVTA